MKRNFIVFCITHAATYGFIILTMVFGWGLYPKSWTFVIIGYTIVSFMYPLIMYVSRNFLKEVSQ